MSEKEEKCEKERKKELVWLPTYNWMMFIHCHSIQLEKDSRNWKQDSNLIVWEGEKDKEKNMEKEREKRWELEKGCIYIVHPTKKNFGQKLSLSKRFLVIKSFLASLSSPFLLFLLFLLSFSTFFSCFSSNHSFTSFSFHEKEEKKEEKEAWQNFS